MKLQKRTRVAVAASILLTIACAVQGMMVTGFKGFIDFPCGYYYQEETQCIEQQHTLYPLDSAKQISLFVDSHMVGFSGLGCYDESSDTNRLEFRPGMLQLDLVREGDRLLVNGKEWPAGETYKQVVFWNLNPWTVYRLEAVNHGLIKICGSDLPPQMIVTGSYGNEASVPKAVIVLAAAIALTFGLSRIGRRKEPTRQASRERQ